MSGKLVGWAFDVEELAPFEKYVLVALAENANMAGVCWPSQAELAHKTGLSERTVLTHLNALENRGLLARETRMNRTGRGRSSDLFRLAGGADQTATVSGENTDQTATDARPNRKRRMTNPQMTTDQPANDDAPYIEEPSKEPSKEPSGEPLPPRDDAIGLCQWLTKQAEEEPRSYNATQLEGAAWLLDHVDHGELRDAVLWAHTRGFWASRVRTAGRLRQVWADLRADWRGATHANRNGKRSVGPTSNDLRDMADQLEAET